MEIQKTRPVLINRWDGEKFQNCGRCDYCNRLSTTIALSEGAGWICKKCLQQAINEIVVTLLQDSKNEVKEMKNETIQPSPG